MHEYKNEYKMKKRVDKSTNERELLYIEFADNEK